jgi:hypothetical protein
MNQNVGASFSLSVLTVLAFAVALYQPENTGQPSLTNPPNSSTSAGPGIIEARPPGLPPMIPESLPEQYVAVSKPAPLRPEAGPGPSAAATARPVARRVTVDQPRRPRAAFTKVRSGESLADVARRVYGSDVAAETLWKSNRDLLDREDVPLREGDLLRTP